MCVSTNSLSLRREDVGQGLTVNMGTFVSLDPTASLSHCPAGWAPRAEPQDDSL